MCIEVIHIQNTITFYTNHIFDKIGHLKIKNYKFERV